MASPLVRYFSFGGWAAPSEEDDADVEEDEEEEESVDAGNDLDSLLQFLEQMARDNCRLIEATYVVNKWALGGIIPMTHHGFVFQTSLGEYFSLDFSRRGIVWDTYGDEIPALPDNTTFKKCYAIDADPLRVKRYCEETKPFVWFHNDCETWSQGLMPVLDITQVRRSQQGRRSSGGPAPAQGRQSLPGSTGSADEAEGSGGHVANQKPAGSKQESGRRRRKSACT